MTQRRPLVIMTVFVAVVATVAAMEERVTFTLAAGGGGDAGLCSPLHQAAVFQSVTECQTRETLVELPIPDTPGDSGSILQVIPGKNNERAI